MTGREGGPGVGHATSGAEAAWIQRNPRLTVREWLRESFEWLRSTRKIADALDDKIAKALPVKASAV